MRVSTEIYVLKLGKSLGNELSTISNCAPTSTDKHLKLAEVLLMALCPGGDVSRIMFMSLRF